MLSPMINILLHKLIALNYKYHSYLYINACMFLVKITSITLIREWETQAYLLRQTLRVGLVDPHDAMTDTPWQWTRWHIHQIMRLTKLETLTRYGLKKCTATMWKNEKYDFPGFLFPKLVL